MEVRASAKNLRVSPQKLLLVTSEIKKMRPQDAISTLDFIPKKPALLIKKAIKSAIANAKNNLGLDEQSLTFKEIVVGKGSVFKRYRPIARGQAHPILKRTSHLTIVLEGQEAKSKQKSSEAQAVSQKGTEDKKDSQGI